ncbi:MAG: universal stress protein [Xanthomonadaceae bacterium]|jgi:nucleotide-binding universal stress UspA family protein|nr:universal stress protein [Xanthomonadaceae bacterium]
MYKRILIATDGSELARKGLEHGLSLARNIGSEVLIITVSEPWMPGFGDALAWNVGSNMVDDYRKTNEDAARKILEEAATMAIEAGVTHRIQHVPDRYPAEAIIETAEAENSDLIVMASHGRRGLGRLLLGSQTNAVLPQSKIPVLVIR